MNDKEKLISLLILTDPNPYTCESESGSCELTTCTECRARSTADLLIAHGVTVQEWISVDDRLPEDDSDVLAYSRNGEEGRIYPANYAKGVWFDCIFTTPVTDTTTHWMPIPQPPKGE